MDNENDRIAALIQLAGKRPAVPADAAARVRAAVHDEWARTTRRRTRMRFAAAAAAVVVVAIAGFVMMRTPAPTQTPSPRAVVASVESVSGAATVLNGTRLRDGDTIETGRGGSVSLKWGNDTLRVDGDTRLRFESGRALFLDRGAVYVASNGSGVVVKTALGEVRDIGTKFEVRLEPRVLRVRVREGRVDVLRRGATHSVEAGVELTSNEEGIARRAVGRSGSEWEWIVRAAPAIALEGKTLRGVVDTVSREKGLTAVYEGNVGDARLHGSVPLAPEEALDAALAASAATARVEDDRLIVRRKR